MVLSRFGCSSPVECRVTVGIYSEDTARYVVPVIFGRTTAPIAALCGDSAGRDSVGNENSIVSRCAEIEIAAVEQDVAVIGELICKSKSEQAAASTASTGRQNCLICRFML